MFTRLQETGFSASPRRMAVLLSMAILALLAALFAAAPQPSGAAGTVQSDGTSTNPPPSSVSVYNVHAFGADANADGADITTVAVPVGPAGNITFGSSVNHRIVGTDWSNWGPTGLGGNADTGGDVYYSGHGVNSVTITLPSGTVAFYLYTLSNLAGTFPVTVDVNSGAASASANVTSPNGATRFAFSAHGGAFLNTITVTYSTTGVDGDPDGFAVGEFGIDRQVVTTTTIALTTGTNPSTVGQSLTFTATVTSADSSNAPGYVNFYDGPINHTLGTCNSVPLQTVSGHRIATCTVSNLAAGDHSITANYLGDNFDVPGWVDSISGPLDQMVQAPTTTTVTSSSGGTYPNYTSVYGEPLTFTATVTASPSNPTNEGTVNFQFSRNGGATWVPIAACQGVALSAGSAQCTPPSVATAHAGSSYEIQAIYSGGGTFAGSTSAAITQSIIAADTTTTLSSNPNPTVYGQPFTITATVTANSPSMIDPVGNSVSFEIDGQPVDCQETWSSTVNLVTGSGGSTATCTIYDYYELENLHVGNHTITAVYNPNSDYNSSNGSMTQVITPASTTTTASAAYYNWAPVPTVAITAHVTINPPSILSFSPTIGISQLFRGDVSFFNGSTLLCTVPLDESGNALCVSAINPATVAPHSLTAIYNWDGLDADFLPSQSTTDVVPTHAGPVITSVTTVFPNNGQAWLVQGAGFSGASSVTVCGISVPFTVVSDTVMLIGVPVVNAPQQCTIIVVATGGTASTNGTVTVVPQPQPGAPVVIYPSGPGTPATPACGPTDSITLSGLWTLVAWSGQDGMSVKDALAGGTDGCGTNITAQVAVVWGFDAATQTYHAYFPSAENVPGANDLTNLTQGLGYWFALVDPTSTVVWKVERGT